MSTPKLLVTVAHLLHLVHLSHHVQALLRGPHLFASGSLGAKHQRDVSPGSSTQRVRGLSPDGAPGCGDIITKIRLGSIIVPLSGDPSPRDCAQASNGQVSLPPTASTPAFGGRAVQKDLSLE